MLTKTQLFTIVPKWRSCTKMGQQYDIRLFCHDISMQLHVVHSRQQFLNASCLTKSHCLIRGFEYCRINVMLILDEIFIINIAYFLFSSSKLVKQCFVELLYRMTKIRFLHVLSQINQIHIKTSRECMFWSICC